MTTEKLNIPKMIHVGYCDRSDTYTKKLAYVIYTDEKGKKRKETSWQSWRDNKIEPDDFDNEPTSGFVLNKGVGGARGSWSSRNVRNEYIRIYDPRGFEFEISVANLLFILTECNANKGKGIEGEFVYAWDGTELILLPVGCAEYKTSTEFTALKSMKVTKKDMKEGLTYQHKDTSQLVYMGRHKVRNFDRCWGQSEAQLLLIEPATARHVFWDIKDERWRFEQGFTKLAVVTNEECHTGYADLHTKLTESKYMAGGGKIVMSPISLADIIREGRHHNYRSEWFFIKVDGGYQPATLATDRPSGRYHRWGDPKPVVPEGQTDTDFWPVDPHVIPEINESNVFNDYIDRYSYYGDPRTAVSSSYIEDKELLTPEIQLQSGKKEEVYNYVKRRRNQEVSASS